MAEDAGVKDAPANPCCSGWIEKYSKLQQRYAKVEDGRTALRKGIEIFEQQIAKMQTENQNLKKAYEEERVRAENEREEKEKGLGMQVSLEDEISALKSQILSLQQKGGSGVEDMNEEVIHLKARLSEGEVETKRLNDLLEKERKRAESQKKKAEAEEKKTNEACQNAKAEKSRADKEREEKLKESAKRVSLENEISSLKSEILSLQQKKGSRDQDVDEEITLLRARLSEGEAEISRLKELLEKERIRAELEKKKADAAKKKAEAEKKKANEEKKLASVEGKKAEEYRLQLERLKTEVEEAKSKLVFEIANSEEAKKKLTAERQKAIKEKKRADAETAKAEEQRKLAEMNRMKAMEEKSCADHLSQQLEEEKRRSEKLQKQVDGQINAGAEKLKDGLQLKRQAGESKSSLECVMSEEAKKRLEEGKQKAKSEKRRADSEMRKAEEQRKVAEVFKEKAMEEKNRADQLAQLLEDHKKSIEELQKEIKEKLVPLDENRNGENDKMKLLRKQLKFERMQLKHAKEVAKLEKGRNSLLQLELCRLKEEFLQFSDRLKILDGCFSHDKVGIHLGKTGKKLSGTEPLNCSESISGIDSQLEPLLRGSNRKMLQSSALNSNLASFSDRQLMGSQGRGTVSGLESDKFAEEKSNPQQPNISKLSCELTTKVTCNETIAVGDENSVRSRLRIGKKRKRIVDAVESIEHLYSEGQKWHLQLSENLTVLHDMLGSRMENSERENFNAKKEKSRKKRRAHLGNPCEQNDEIGSNGNEEANVDLHDSVQDVLGNFEVTAANYLKLLELDNSADERTYRLAMARPLSPLPESMLRIDKFKTKIPKQLALGNANDNLVPRCSSDAMNLETESNNCKDNIDNTANVPPLQKEGNVHTFEVGVNDEDARVSQICEAVPRILCKSNLGSECGDQPQYCVVFSHITDCSSVSKVFCATRTCLAQCPVISEKDWVVKKLMFALSKVESLLPKEKVCVFFSTLLHNFSRVALENFTNFTDGGFKTLDSFAGHMRNVMSDVEARSMFAELCNLEELLALIEDFLVYRRVLVRTDQSSKSLLDSDPMANIPLNCDNLILSVESASNNQLVAGGVVVSSLFAAIDQIGFICEASYNIFRLQRIDSPMLTVLHAFAYICGPKYFTLDDYHLIMTLIKSLITFLEGENSSANSGLVACTNCPFSVGAVCMNVVVSMLVEKLQNSQEDTTESLKLINFEAGSHRDENEPSSGHNLEDILFLLELVACKMSWDWTCNNIVNQLLKLLESCVAENLLAAIIILLGQLGRLGVEAKGYEDPGVQHIRERLAAFLCQITWRKTGLAIQVANVTALLGVISLNFEELVKKSNSELPILVSNSIPSAADCIIKWFSLLNKEQQSVSFSLLSAVAH